MIILPVVLYVCETWPLTLREVHRRILFKNRVLRKTLEPKSDKVREEYRKLHNEEVYDLCYSPNIIRMVK
jgi:hypothetical protein